MESAAPEGGVRLLAREPMGQAGSDSRGAVFGDFDGDGLDDLFVARFKAINTLWKRRPDGGYEVGVAGSAGAHPSRSFDACAGDLDGDGDLDLFVANANGEPNELHRNIGGELVFESLRGGSVGAQAKDSYAGVWSDLDGDGDLDLAVVNRLAGNELHRNDGSGMLSLVRSDVFASGNGNSRDVAAGDLDGDGDADLVVVNAHNEPDQVFLNQGAARAGQAGWFQLVSDGAVSRSLGWSSGCDLADVDGDGDLDLVIAGRKGDATRLFRNRGDGRFDMDDAAVPTGAPGNSSACAFVDLDGVDGPDILVAKRKGPAAAFLNDGSGRFRSVTDLDPEQAPLESTGIAIGAVEADGGLEVILTDALGPMLRLRLKSSGS